MMNTISLVSASFVARQLDYDMTGGWMEGDTATNDYFRPLETFAERFDGLLSEVAALGFEAIDIWVAHLNPAWATDEHISIARDRLAAHNLRVASLAGWYGETYAEAEQYCRLAAALGTGIIGGHIPLVETDRAAVARLLEQYGIRLGLENHPEKNAADIRARVGEGGPIGACVDTGWFGTHGTDAAGALADLAPIIVNVHLKDVRAAGGHDTCRFGDGVVPLERCVRVLQQAGYIGPLSIEHEPESYDPTEEIRQSLAMLRGWLSKESDQ